MLFNRDSTQTLQPLAARLKAKKLQRFLTQVYEVRKLIDSNLNTQLMLETLLLEWQCCLQQAQH
jgi:hypothetical protein